MRLLHGTTAVVLLTLLALPITADAFSRRTHGSEVARGSSPASRTLSPTHEEGSKSGEGTSSELTGSSTRGTAPVPEPSTLALLATGLGGLLYFARTKRQRA